MFRSKPLSSHLLTALVLSLCIGVSAAPVMAESSTGIHLGTTDFGGKSRLDSGWSRTDPGSRSWSRQAPGDRSWSREKHHSIDISDRPNTGQKPHLGQQHNKREHHDGDRKHRFHGDRHHFQGARGINGHLSFGFTPHYERQKRFHGHSRYPVFYYRNDGVQVNYAPQVYSNSYTQQSGTVITGYRQPETSDNYSIDPWTALGDYQIDTARYAFEAQIQQRPNAALPRVGLAVSTALSGDLDGGAFVMEDALLSDTSDLRYFSADQNLQLVFEELLLSYEGDPLMTASLHYLNRDYQAADRAVQVAADYCQQCTAVNRLSALIDNHY